MKMFVKTIILLSLFDFSCKRPSPDLPEKKCTFEVAEYRKEYLLMDSVTINGKVPFMMTKKQFRIVFGVEDSSEIAPQNLYYSLFADSIKGTCVFYHLGNSLFVSKGGYVFPIILDIATSTVDIRFKGKVFNNKSSVHPFIELFPLSAKIFKGTLGNAFTGSIVVDANDYNTGEGFWYFIFIGDGLNRISYFTPPVRPY